MIAHTRHLMTDNHCCYVRRDISGELGVRLSRRSRLIVHQAPTDYRAESFILQRSDGRVKPCSLSRSGSCAMQESDLCQDLTFGFIAVGQPVICCLRLVRSTRYARALLVDLAKAFRSRSSLTFQTPEIYLHHEMTSRSRSPLSPPSTISRTFSCLAKSSRNAEN